MSLSHFPDPDLPEFRDARLREDVLVVHAVVVDAYGLGDAAISPLDTGSYNIHFRVERAGEAFDLRRTNRPNAPGNLACESAILVHMRQNGFNLAPEIGHTLTAQKVALVVLSGNHHLSRRIAKSACVGTAPVGF